MLLLSGLYAAITIFYLGPLVRLAIKRQAGYSSSFSLTTQGVRAGEGMHALLFDLPPV